MALLPPGSAHEPVCKMWAFLSQFSTFAPGFPVCPNIPQTCPTPWCLPRWDLAKTCHILQTGGRQNPAPNENAETRGSLIPVPNDVNDIMMWEVKNWENYFCFTFSTSGPDFPVSAPTFMKLAPTSTPICGICPNDISSKPATFCSLANEYLFVLYGSEVLSGNHSTMTSLFWFNFYEYKFSSNE